MLYKESNDNILLCDECEDDYINRCKEIGGEYVDLSNSEPAPAYINVLYEYGNGLIISSKSHPVFLVQFEITERIKENTKVYFFTNEGADDYIKHCEDLNGEYKNLSSNKLTSFNSQYTILEITENDCQQDDFSDKLYNALRCIWDDVKSTSGKKVIYLNNISLF